MAGIDDIKAIYLRATAETIRDDLARAIAIFKSMESEAERERAAVYMDGLSQMRAEWGSRPRKSGGVGRQDRKPDR